MITIIIILIMMMQIPLMTMMRTLLLLDKVTAAAAKRHSPTVLLLDFEEPMKIFAPDEDPKTHTHEAIKRASNQLCLSGWDWMGCD